MKGTFPVPSEPRLVGVAVVGTAVPRWRGNSFHQLTFLLEVEVMAIVTVGIDLAKNVFAVHGVNEAGKPELVRPEVPRGKLLELVAKLPPCLIGMEACSGAHHWAREFEKYGYTVRLMAAKFVAPSRMSGKRGKNDAADAAAICEAVTRPSMRFVPLKSLEQQSRLFVHRADQSHLRVAVRTGHRAAPESRHRTPRGAPAPGEFAWLVQHRGGRHAQ